MGTILLASYKNLHYYHYIKYIITFVHIYLRTSTTVHLSHNTGYRGSSSKQEQEHGSFKILESDTWMIFPASRYYENKYIFSVHTRQYDNDNYETQNSELHIWTRVSETMTFNDLTTVPKPSTQRGKYRKPPHKIIKQRLLLTQT